MSGVGMRPSGPVERISIEQQLRLKGKFIYTLDDANMRIISLMHKLGPRNLLEVARAAGLPPTSVYDRARKLEERFRVLAAANVDHSKLGLRKCVTLVESNPGMEDYVTEALAVPNYWKTITRCEGGFTHYGLHAIPDGRSQEFERYVAEIEDLGLIRKHETVWVTDYHYTFPDFRLYDPVNCSWSFEWNRWSDRIKERRASRDIRDPSGFSNEADRTDMLILTELEINARAKFSDISKLLGITLQAVKHRYDKRIVPRGLIKEFVMSFLLYPPELSDLYEVLLAFENEEGMNAFFGASEGMFPILRTVKVLGERKISVRAHTPRSETERLFSMLSGLARSGVVADYSAVRIRPETQTWQTISAELFGNKSGWKYESSQHFAALDTIVQNAKVRA